METSTKTAWALWRSCLGANNRADGLLQRFGSNRIRPKARWWRGLLAVPVVALGLSSCSRVDTTPVVGEDLARELRQGLTNLYVSQEPISGPLTLSEAMARGVIYNIDHRVAVFEKALARQRAGMVPYDAFPKLVASAGYQWRSVPEQARTRIGTTTTPGFSQRQASESFGGQVGLSWSLLDFVLSSFRRNKAANLANAETERNRLILQNLIQQIRSHYWQAVAAERMLANMNPVVIQLNDALRQSELAEVQRLVPPLESLEYQRSLYTILQDLEETRRRLIQVKTRLATLINLDQGQQYRVLIPHNTDISPLESRFTSVGQLEDEALRKRPELREQRYRERLLEADSREILAQLLPDVSLSASARYSSNSFLRYQTWLEASPMIAWNAVNLLAVPERRRVAANALELERMRTLATATAILAQVNISVGYFDQSLREYRNAEKIFKVNNRIMKQTLAASDARGVSPIDRIRAEANNLAAQLRLDLAFSELQDSFGQVLLAVGDDPLPSRVSDDPQSVAELIPIFETYNDNFGVRYDLPIKLLYYNI